MRERRRAIGFGDRGRQAKGRVPGGGDLALAGSGRGRVRGEVRGACEVAARILRRALSRVPREVVGVATQVVVEVAAGGDVGIGVVGNSFVAAATRAGGGRAGESSHSPTDSQIDGARCTQRIRYGSNVVACVVNRVLVDAARQLRARAVFVVVVIRVSRVALRVFIGDAGQERSVPARSGIALPWPWRR